jgi:hypothetical protein
MPVDIIFIYMTVGIYQAYIITVIHDLTLLNKESAH